MEINMEIKKTLFFSLLAFLFLLPSNALANSAEDNASIPEIDSLPNEDEVLVLDRAKYSSKEDFQNEVDMYMNDESILELKVIDSRIIETKEDLIMPQSVVLPYITNVKNRGQITKTSKTLATVWGDPGISMSLTNSWKVKSTKSGNIDSKYVSMGLSFTIGRSYTVSYTGKYKVPSSVKRAKITAHPVYQKYSFSIMKPKKDGWFKTKFVKTGTGYAYKPIGVYYKKNLIK